MESVKKSIDERAQHKREYDSWVNERQIQTAEDKVDTGKAVDASLNIRPIMMKSQWLMLQTTAEINIFATGQQHTEQPEFNNEGKVDQNVEQCHDTCPLPAKFTDNQTTELSNQSLESENIRLKKTVAQFQKDFKMEAQKIFDSSTTKVDSEPPNGSNEDITNPYECEQTLNLSADVPINETTSMTNLIHLFRRSYALELELLARRFFESPDHRIHKDGDGDASFQLNSDSLPHAHAQTTKTF
ncbi:hypothetical protein Tco_0634563 [Tanacetum coccineum]